VHVTVEQQEVEAVEVVSDESRGSDELRGFIVSGGEKTANEGTNGEDEEASIGEERTRVVDTFAMMSVIFEGCDRGERDGWGTGGTGAFRLYERLGGRRRVGRGGGFTDDVTRGVICGRGHCGWNWGLGQGKR